jgi:hypothetical protein
MGECSNWSETCQIFLTQCGWTRYKLSSVSKWEYWVRSKTREADPE